MFDWKGFQVSMTSLSGINITQQDIATLWPPETAVVIFASYFSGWLSSNF